MLELEGRISFRLVGSLFNGEIRLLDQRFFSCQNCVLVIQSLKFILYKLDDSFTKSVRLQFKLEIKDCSETLLERLFQVFEVDVVNSCDKLEFRLHSL